MAASVTAAAPCAARAAWRDRLTELTLVGPRPSYSHRNGHQIREWHDQFW